VGKTSQLLASSFIFILRAYRYFISPFLGLGCRFFPSCSVYAIEALRTHGVWRGSYYILNRLLRCHPACQGGFDPVPTANGKKSHANQDA